MDPLAQAFYEEAFRGRYVQTKADEFQDLFCRIMGLRYPGDFIRTCPWGNEGDKKNDGYLPSQRTLFAVYAPNEMSEANAISKMKSDFAGALPHWEEFFDTWVFVHNSYKGIGPNHTLALLDLHKQHPHVLVQDWGYETLRQVVFQLSETDLISVLGPGRAPAYAQMLMVRYEDIKHVLHNVSQQPPDIEQDLRPVPSEKLNANNLSESIITLLNAGMTRAQLVGNYFRDFVIDPTLGEGLAATFRQWYFELRSDSLLPDEIFLALHVRIGGGSYPTPELEGAALAVLAYFFEKCDIFERPEQGSIP